MLSSHLNYKLINARNNICHLAGTYSISDKYLLNSFALKMTWVSTKLCDSLRGFSLSVLVQKVKVILSYLRLQEQLWESSSDIGNEVVLFNNDKFKVSQMAFV